MTPEPKKFREVPLKQFLTEEAERLRTSVQTIEHRWRAGRYAHIPTRRVNKRVIFILLPAT